MLKLIRFAALALLVAVGFTACSDDENPVVIPPTDPAPTRAFVINQGNMYSNIAGSVSMLNLEDSTVTNGYFKAVNGKVLGDTPEHAVRYGSKIYIPMNGSGCVWVVDAATMRQVAQIPVEGAWAVCGTNGKIFIASYNGFVCSTDTTTLATPTLKDSVGPNPADIIAANGKVYVTISDGYNYLNNYANGKKVVALNPETLEKVAEYAVEINPSEICANSKGELFVVSIGDYVSVMPKIQKIALDGTVTDYGKGLYIAMNGDMLYSVNVEYAGSAVNISSYAYNTATDEKVESFLPADNMPPMPNAIDVDPVTGNIYICSNKSSSAYNEAGYVYQYSVTNTWTATFVHRYNVGVQPYSVVF